MTNQKKAYTIIAIAVIAVVLVALFIGFQTGAINTGRSSPTPTPSASSMPTITPTSSPTANPTAASTQTPNPTASPSPTLPPPSFTVTVTGNKYDETWAQYTQFDCTVKINNAAYNYLVDKMVTAQDFSVSDGLTHQTVTGNLTTALQAIFPQLGMNYGIAGNMTVSNVGNGQFTLTLYSATKTVLPGGINLDTLGSALTSRLNELLATQK